MRNSQYLFFFLALAFVVGCMDLSNQQNGEKTYAPSVSSDDMDSDGLTDGYDTDEIVGPIAEYPTELWVNAGALSFPWMGEDMSFQCRNRDGDILTFAWQYWYDGEATLGNTWFVAYVDDRADEGSWLCAFTRDGRSVLDLEVNANPLVWTRDSVCLFQENTGVYSASYYNSCDGIRGF